MLILILIKAKTFISGNIGLLISLSKLNDRQFLFPLISAIPAIERKVFVFWSFS